MTDTFRALCAELANHLQGRKELECGWGEEDPEQDLLDRARAALAQPEPQGPMDEDAVAACPFDSFHEPAEYYGWWSAIEWAEQHWCRPAIKPVPLSERLPGAEDCDPSFQCWWFTPSEEKWILWPIKWAGPECSHWLPHYALPVPTTHREEN